MRIFIVFGGPSLERAISLNSARSLADHLHAFDVPQSWVFVSQDKTFHFIDKTWLYCNTIEDFEFKLSDSLSWAGFSKQLKKEDLVFSLIHGDFGEDGEFSSWLEQAGIDFVGPSSHSCAASYLKDRGLAVIDELQLTPGPYALIRHLDDKEKLGDFMSQFPEGQKFFMKPNAGGSSIGAQPFSSAKEFWEAFEKNPRYFEQGAIVERFYDDAEEFCVTVFAESDDSAIHCLAPMTIDYDSGEFYDYRKKYMLSDHSRWQCPAQWPSDYVSTVTDAARILYRKIKARGLIRIDGWLFDGGRIAFSDINLISGFEQNSLLFRQAAVCGLSHQALCRWLITHVGGKDLPQPALYPKESKRPVYIVFGGDSSEKQTSMLSGINVWLKLISQSDLEVVPYLWESEKGLRPVPYHAMLSHGLKGLMEAMSISKAAMAPYRLPFADLEHEGLHDPSYALSIPAFLTQAKRQKAFVFLALHGGDGENGVWQSWLIQAGVPFNGSGPAASAIGMDKKKTAEVINALGHPKIRALPKCVFHLDQPVEVIMQQAHEFSSRNPFPWILKPRSEGCSSGVMLLDHLPDLAIFVARLQQLPEAEEQSFSAGFEKEWLKIEDCSDVVEWMIEPMISCGKVLFGGDQAISTQGSGWIELTQGVIQSGGSWKTLPASLVVAEGNILTLEEKFQGGTGTNVTPVPFFTPDDHWWLSRAMIQAAESLGIEHYARFDLFYHRETRDIIIIEVNTLPGLTASTVLFHQLILEGMTPQDFFSWLIEPQSQPTRILQQEALVV